MRSIFFPVVLLLMFFTTPAGAAPAVAYEVRARTVTWIPIRLPDLQHGIGSKVVSVLGSGGIVRLSKARWDKKARRLDLSAADLLLQITGEVVEDAGNFTVTLSLRPVRDAGLPSYVTSSTVSISGKPKRVMYTRIVEAADKAAQKLRGALRSRPEFAGPGGKLPAAVSADLLFDWGRVMPPRAKVSGRDMATFANTRLTWHKRKEAAFRLAALAYDNADVRHLFERAALTDPDKYTRLYAVRMLEPSSRSHRFTQKVILAVLREDANPEVKSYAFSISQHFFGLSPHETAQTWVQLLTSKVAEFNNRSFANLTKLMGFRVDDMPNVDLGLIGCLKTQEVLDEGRRRKEACLDIVEKLPPGRRTAILISYLNQPLTELANDLPDRWRGGPFGTAIKVAFKDPCQRKVLRAVLGRLLSEALDVRTKAEIITHMANDQLTPAVIRAAAEIYGETPDRKVRSKMEQVVQGPKRRYKAPWGVLAWPAARAAARKLLDGNLERHQRRNMESLLKSLDKAEGQAHKTGLRKYLKPDGPPLPGAVDHFVQCILSSTSPREGRRAARDCAGGLRWLALTFPQHRRLAVAAIFGLLTQKRVKLHGYARSSLRSTISKLGYIYRKQPTDQGQWGQCTTR